MPFMLLAFDTFFHGPSMTECCDCIVTIMLTNTHLRVYAYEICEDQYVSGNFDYYSDTSVHELNLFVDFGKDGHVCVCVEKKGSSVCHLMQSLQTKLFGLVKWVPLYMITKELI